MCCNMLLLVIGCFSAIIPGCWSVTLKGFFPTEEGTHHLGRFCFSGYTQVKFDINKPDENLRLLLFMEAAWYGLRSFTCDMTDDLALHHVKLSNTSGSYDFSRGSPYYMHLVYTHCNHSGQPLTSFNIELLNRETMQEEFSHFGPEESGLLGITQFFLIAYLVAAAMVGKRLYVIVQKGGPMHLAVRMLSMAQLFKILSLSALLIHYYRFSTNGLGLPYVRQLSKVFDGLLHYQMLVMVAKLATGGILSSVSMCNYRDERMIHHAIMFLSSCQIVFLVLDLTAPVLVFRLAVCGAIAYSVHSVIKRERSALKRDFYHKLVRDNYIWWGSFPLATAFSVICAEYFRRKFVFVLVTLGNTLASLLMYKLFLSRSLYWEVSSLSSATLPLNMDRSFGLRKYTS